MKEYYEGVSVGPVDLAELLEQLEIPRSERSRELKEWKTEFAYSYGKARAETWYGKQSKYGWNDPLQAYTALLNFLEKHEVKHAKAQFEILIQVKCKRALTRRRRGALQETDVPHDL